MQATKGPVLAAAMATILVGGCAPRLESLPVMAHLDDGPFAICEIARSGRFIVGTGGRDSVQLVDRDGQARRIADLPTDPEPGP